MEKFGIKLYYLRKQKKLSQQKLGEMLDVSGSHIGAMERNEKMPNAPMILKIAAIFDVTTDELMKDDLDLA